MVLFIGQSGTARESFGDCPRCRNCPGWAQRLLLPLANIIDSLAHSEREGRLSKRIRFRCRSSFLIIDDIAYVSVGAGSPFLQLVNARYELGAMILTSDRGFAEWGKVFGDPAVATALLDRLLHHAAFGPPTASAAGCANMPTWSPRACGRRSTQTHHVNEDGHPKPLLPEQLFVRSARDGRRQRRKLATRVASRFLGSL